MEYIGKGKIRSRKSGKKYYLGNLPYKPGTKVVVIKLSDLESMLESSEQVLLTTKKKMPKNWYDLEDLENVPLFEDEIDYTAKDGTIHKLYLDRHTYSANQKDMIWIRFVSCDQSLIEENDTLN